MNTKLNLHQDSSIFLIRRYQNRIITIRNADYKSSVIVTPAEVINWPLTDLSALDSRHFSPIFELDFRPEMIILGTGEKLHFPQPHQTQALINAQIGLEVMDTAAACRTYNILVDDGRKVAACLLV